MTGPILDLIPEAKADLQEIWIYTAERWGLTQAERYVAQLKSACNRLMESPSLGKPLPGVGDCLRVYRSQHHYIFYLEEQERMTFLAFLHERQDTLRHVITRLP